MSPHCVWMITVGGRVDESNITFPNIVMLTELGKYIFLLNFWSIKCGVSARERYSRYFSCGYGCMIILKHAHYSFSNCFFIRK